MVLTFNTRRVGAANIATLLQELTFCMDDWDVVMLQVCELPGPPRDRPLGLLGHHLVWATDALGIALVVPRRWRDGIVGEWRGGRIAAAAVSVGAEGIFAFASIHAPTS